MVAGQCRSQKLQEEQHTTHFVNLGLVHLFASPVLSFNLLNVRLPFGEKSDLPRLVSICIGIGDQSAYNVYRIVDFAVCPELALDVLVAEHSHLLVKMLSVTAEYSSIQWDGREQSWRDLLEA